MSAPSARSIAAAALIRLETDGGFSNRVLSDVLDRHPGLSGRDRGFATTLYYGVLRHRARLDALIDQVARDPKRLPAPARLALRLGVLELRELGQPPHAAISQAVNAVKRSKGGTRLAPLVQAILGHIDREGEAMEATMAAGKPLDVLASVYSIPRWWAGRMLKQLGPEQALRRAAAFALTPDLELRVDLHRTSREEVALTLGHEVPGAKVTEHHRTPGGLRVHGGGDLFRTPLHENGLISIQSLASQQVVDALPLRAGMHVLDACAGMGVKTLQMAERMERGGTIVANDPSTARQRRAEEIIDRGRLPADMVTFTDHDLANAWPAEFDGAFDAILVDAPCTGLGNVGRHPEIRWQRTFSDISQNATRQGAILKNCLRGLRPGASLVYAVCSLEPEEGPAVVDSILGSTDAGVRETARGHWTPEEDGGEGFFWAALQRPEPSSPAQPLS